MHKKPTFGKIIVIIPLVIAGIIVFGLITQYLWNWLIPDLFHGPRLTYLQTLGLFILVKILLPGGFGGHNNSHRHSDRQHEFPWKRHFREELETQEPTHPENEAPIAES